MDLRRRSTPTDRLISLGMLVTLLAYLFLLYRGYLLNEKRKEQAAVRSLDLGVNEARQDLDNFFQAMDQTLDEVVARVKVKDSALSSMEFVEEMLPIIRNNEAITNLSLADAQGNEKALLQEHGEYLLRTTTDASAGVMPTISTVDVDLRAGITIGPPDTLGGAHDPRSQPWFAHALNDHRGTSRWLGPAIRSKDGTGTMIGTLPIRDPQRGQDVRVAMIEVELIDLIQRLRFRPAGREASLFIVTSENIQFTGANKGVEVDSLVDLGEHAVQRWIVGQTSAPLHFEHNGTRFATRIIPYNLNGYDMYAGAVVPVKGLKTWSAEHVLMVLSGLVILLFASLFYWSSIRKRRDMRRILMQEERSRSTHEKLQQALGEREVLDREVHHRVKNNLQIMTSLINLQSRSLVQNSSALEEFKRAQRRIGAIATVHMKLYGLQDLRGVDLQPFLEGLVHEVKKDHQESGARISCAVLANRVKLDLDPSIDIGLAVHELVSNCYEHAFPHTLGGHVDVVINDLGEDRYELTVSDNGVGIPKDLGKEGRIGLEVVELIAEKLDGTFSYTTENGTTCMLRFEVSGATSTLLRP